MNSTVPIASEVLKLQGVYDPKRVIGVTTLDLVRASTFIAQAKVTTNVALVYVMGLNSIDALCCFNSASGTRVVL